MSFKAKNAGNTGSGNRGDFERGPQPVPKSGIRKARISLIVDLGTQEREDFEEKDKNGVVTGTRPQKPCHQVAVFADLVQDNVDYGGSIGKAQYRLLLNKSFGGEVTGVNFTTTPPKDANGKIIEGKPWTLHPASLLTKLAKATGNDDVIESTDIEKLLNAALMIDVDVKEKVADKKDADGNPIVFKYVNFRGASKVPMVETGEEDDDGNPIEAPMAIPELKQPARLISFENATVDDVKFLRRALIEKIKLAKDYAGSAMERAIQSYEAANGDSQVSDDEGEDDAAPSSEAVKKAAPAKKVAAKTKPVPQEEDDSSPF